MPRVYGSGSYGFQGRGIGAELHIKDEDSDLIALPHLTPHIQLLNGLELGPLVDQRSGRVVHLKKLMLRWNCFWAPQATTQGLEPCTIGVFIVKDIQPGASTPNYADIFNSTAIQAFSNIDAVGRFKSVYRHIFEIGPGGGVQGNAASKASNYGGTPFGEFYKSMNDRVKFDGPDADTASIFDCAYYLIVVCDYHQAASQTPGTSSQMNIEYHTRIRFADL